MVLLNVHAYKSHKYECYLPVPDEVHPVPLDALAEAILLLTESPAHCLQHQTGAEQVQKLRAVSRA